MKEQSSAWSSTISVCARMLATLLLASILSACGGGGGSSGDSGSPGSSQTVRGGHIVDYPGSLKSGKAYTIRFNKLEGPNEILISGETQQGFLRDKNGEAETVFLQLVRTDELDLRFILPPGIENGEYVLTVILDNLDPFDFSIKVTQPDFVEFETARYYLQDHINTSLLELDALIAQLQSQNAAPANVNDVIDARNALEAVNLEQLTLEDINFLYRVIQQQQAMLVGSEAKARAAYNELTCSTMSDQKIKEVIRVARGAGLIAIASYGATAAPPLAAAMAAIGGATLYVNAKKLVDGFDDYWDGCVYPADADLVPGLLQSKSAMARSAPAIDYPNELELNAGTAKTYQLNRTLGVAESLRGDFYQLISSISEIAEDYPYLVPEVIRSKITSYLQDEEFHARSSALSIQSISPSNIQGEIIAIDDATFSLSFTADSDFYTENSESQFEFNLYDADYEQNIRFIANLGTKHCPSYFTKPSDTISIVETEDNCLVTVIDSPSNPSDSEITEFVYGEKRRFEKREKDLVVYKEDYWLNGNLASVVDYYPLRQNSNGTWVNLVESIYHYYESGLINSEELSMDPFQAKGQWFSPTKTLVAYDELDADDHGEVYTEYLWSDPLLNDDGSYAVCEQSRTHWNYGYYTAFEHQEEFDEQAGYWTSIDSDNINHCDYYPQPY